MRRLLPLLAALVLTAPAFAQERGNAPDLPKPLQALAERGAQMRYLGSEHGMDGWIAIYQGQEQYYYVTPDKKGFVTGLMFGAEGEPVTIEQVRQLQAQSGGALDILAEDAPEASTTAAETPASVSDAISKKTPGERMFADVENSNWLRLGSETAPVIYMFIDPQCPHCHKLISELRKSYLPKGAIQVRIVPVGFQQGSLAQAAFLLASPDGEARLYKHLDGDASALPAKNDISTQAIQKNMALMQAWKFNITPLTVYRGRDGQVKLVRGVVKDIPALIADLPLPSSTPAAK